MSYSRIMLIAMMLVAILVFAGCGSDNRAGKDMLTYSTSYGTDASGISYVGANVCINCHEGFSWSSARVADYLESSHVNHDGSINSLSDISCKVCHDPVGDGRTLESYIDIANIPLYGLAAVTCEACHGAGGEHYGTGPMPNPNPNEATCGKCHNSAFTHNTMFPEADNIYEDLLNSQHYNGGIHGEDDEGNVNPRCARCHTDEGGRMYKFVQGDTASLTAYFANEPLVENASPIQCRTCHDSHNPGKLLRSGSSSASAEFNTCTNCHQIGTIDSTSRTGTLSMPYHRSGDYPRADRTILDTHFDNATTANIEGYVLDITNEHVCRDCHNVHLANVGVDTDHTETAGTKINMQWASSSHGGRIIDTTYVGGVANVTEAEAPAFVHYDFKASNRTSCQRCHTATGFKNYANDPLTYDPLNNIFNATNMQREMLYCWACHTNNAGGLRNPGAINATYASAPHQYPDVAGSNICMACHTGRESGETIKNSTAAFTNTSFINSHYLAAGGTVFTATGYEYDGQSYANESYYKHDLIGSTAAEGTGLNGPCVGCHMSGEANHIFIPVETNIINGVITAITANANVCSNCHAVTDTGDHTLTVAEINEQKEGCEDALVALEDYLAAAGFVFTTGYPYFSNTDWTSVADPTGKLNMGAAFNFNLLHHDPGAYAHNRFYTKRLIFDSINWIDNGSMEATIDLSAYPVAAEWFQADGNAANDNAVNRP